MGRLEPPPSCSVVKETSNLHAILLIARFQAIQDYCMKNSKDNSIH